MTGYQKQEILLESGTNEMEIIEFYLNSQSFGINVQKLKEIIPYDKGSVTAVPGGAKGMLGTLLLRGSTIPLIDLKMSLSQKNKPSDVETRQVVLVCEFNNRINGFKVDGVNQIHRVSWQDVQPMATFIDQYRPRFTGSLNIEGRDILIVDLEHIVAEYDPESSLDFGVDGPQAPLPGQGTNLRKQMMLMLAEDSSLIRDGIEKVLREADYSNLKVFVDGQDCYDSLFAIKKKVEQGEQLDQYINLLITDIEMPKLDGLTLCKRIKDDSILRDIKVVLFSSLINDQMIDKCNSVHADGYATKPQIPYLVEMMDRLLEIAPTTLTV
jgi:two-component system chemotaxis response regulator CheV